MAFGGSPPGIRIRNNKGLAVGQTAFATGNKIAKNNRGPWRTPITQQIVSQLNEVWDKSDPASRTKLQVMTERLISVAIGEDRKVPLVKIEKNKKGESVMVAIANRDGSPKMVVVPGVPDLSAIKEITDRVQGRAPQQITVAREGEGDLNVTMIFGDMDPQEMLAQFEEARRNAGTPKLKLVSPPADRPDVDGSVVDAVAEPSED